MSDDVPPVAYATVSDLEARWRTLDSTEKARAGVLLGDAKVRIDAECPVQGDPSSSQLEARKIVSCNMVKRAMLNGEQAAGIESTQATAGPFSRSFNFSNPTGDMYIKKDEKRMLGCRAGRAFTIDTAPPGSGVQPWTGSTL